MKRGYIMRYVFMMAVVCLLTVPGMAWAQAAAGGQQADTLNAFKNRIEKQNDKHDEEMQAGPIADASVQMRSIDEQINYLYGLLRKKYEERGENPTGILPMRLTYITKAPDGSSLTSGAQASMAQAAQKIMENQAVINAYDQEVTNAEVLHLRYTTARWLGQKGTRFLYGYVGNASSDAHINDIIRRAIQ